MTKVITAARPQAAWGATSAIEDRFRPMIAELEVLAAQKPGLYRARVFRRALLGYGYISLIILTILGIIGAAIAVMILGHHVYILAAKPLIILVIAAGYILRALWVKIPSPEGLKIQAHEAPKLFAMLAEVRRKTKGPQVDAVYMTGDFNASITQLPRFGPFAGHRNVLSLGLPLMSALSADEVMAVVAHEYGHLAGAHGKMSAWVYRVRMTWLQLSQSFASGVIGKVFHKFFKWYGPWFSAYSFVMARGDEYEADRAAANVAGAAITVRALSRVAVESHRYNRFWATLFERSGDEAQVYPHALMSQHFVQPMAADDFEGAMKIALADKTDIHDTHPCLQDRLKSLGEGIGELPPVVETGAVALLGLELTERLALKLDADWWKKAGGYWSERREDAQKQRVKLVELEAKAATGPLTDEESWTYQSLLEGVGEKARAIDVARQRFIDQPEDISARLVLGRLLLESDEAEGLELMQGAFGEKLYAKTRLFALDQCLDYLKRHNPEDPRITEYQAMLDEGVALMRNVDAELERVDEKAQLEPAGLDEAVISAIRTHAARAGQVKSVWVAKRRLRGVADEFQFVVLIDAGADTDTTQVFAQDVLEVLQTHGNAFVVIQSKATDWLKRRMDQVDGARVLKR